MINLVNWKQEEPTGYGGLGEHPKPASRDHLKTGQA
jgi:hypothetical protein